MFIDSGEKVRAMVPVHLFGLCCEMDAIHEISERYQLDVIEDAAQAIGAEYPFAGKTARAGAMGEAGFFGDTVVLLGGGEIVQQGTLDEMIRSPASDYVARFINAQRLPGVEAKEEAQT